MRAKVRRDKEEPREMKSKTDMLAPRLEIPNTANDDPRRTKLRSDIEAPKWRKSRTDIDDPSLVMP
jgi:hypothetical protein